MYYYAYINEKNIVEDVYALRKAISDGSYIEIAESVYTATINGTEGSIVGKYWNGSIFIDKVIYYAIVEKVNDIYLVKEIIKSEEAIDKPGEYIEVESFEATKRGQIYDPNTGIFRDAKFHEIADTDTNYISVKGTDVSLSQYLDDTQTMISNEVAATSLLEKLKGVDGVESGLDADLLDGKQADYFATNEVLQALNTTVNTGNVDLTSRINKVEEAVKNIKIPEVTSAVVLEKVKAVDGMGSGLDADLLDGNDSTYFATSKALQALTTTVDSKATATDLVALKTVVAGKADSNHTHQANAVTAYSGFPWELQLANSSTTEITSELCINSQRGGWGESNKKIVVPKTGDYMINLDGRIELVSGSLTSSDSLLLSIRVKKSDGSKIIGDDCVFTMKDFDGTMRILQQSGSSPNMKIVTLNAGEIISLEYKLTSEQRALNCNVKISRMYVNIQELY